MTKYYWVYMLFFIILKLTEVIDWSWWYLIIPICVYWLIYIFFVLLTITLVIKIFNKAFKEHKK